MIVNIGYGGEKNLMSKLITDVLGYFGIGAMLLLVYTFFGTNGIVMFFAVFAYFVYRAAQKGGGNDS